MTTSTIRNDYVHGKNLATMVGKSLAGANTYANGSKITDRGVYEITFNYSLLKSNTTGNSNPHFFIGFGIFTSNTAGSFNHATLIRLGADNTASSDYPNQAPVTVWVVKTDDVEMDFMCKENASISNWNMYNVNAVAKKIADV